MSDRYKTSYQKEGSQKSAMDQVREHSYDGIQEYDNPLPSWWVWLFVLSIGFGFAYLGWYQFMGGKSLLNEFREEVAAQQALQRSAGGGGTQKPGATGPNSDGPVDFAARYGDQTLVESGREVYQTNCAPCHGDRGQGVIGPNLTDNFWLHGSDAGAITTAIAEGIPDKGMPAWNPVLGPSKTEAVAAFVYTALNGKNVEGGKAPQGVETKK